MALASAGERALANVEHRASEGRHHLPSGQTYNYGTRFPTSGPHDPSWAPTGVHERPQPPTQLVHALEHGNVVIYYDALEPAAMATLREWATLYSNMWSGLVVTPIPGIGESVVLTAWNRRLRLDRFDPAVAAAFIDAYRGRGPENPVR